MPICSAITNTMGGIVVDGQARVLDTKGALIPACSPRAPRSAASMAARIPVYVGGLIKAVIGLIAAEDDLRRRGGVRKAT